MTKLTLHEVKPPSLRKLRGLIVRTCPVRQISADVFKLLPSLGILDLSRNGIEKMPVASDHTYADTSLPMLFLHRNEIRFISDVHLNLYLRVRLLNLDNNLMVSINNDSFTSAAHNVTRRISTLETLSIYGQIMISVLYMSVWGMGAGLCDVGLLTEKTKYQTDA